jgi:hypothetical protein
MEAREPAVIEGTGEKSMYSVDQHDRTLYFADLEMDDNEGTLEEALQNYQGQRVRVTSQVTDHSMGGSHA